MMLIGRQSQVGMYFVGDDECTAIPTDRRNLSQFFYRPDASSRIVGIAEDKYFTTLYILAETIEIDMILPVAKFQRRIDGFTPQTLRHQEERMVDRRHHHHPVARVSEALQGKSLTTDNAGHKSQHPTVHFPLMAVVQPRTDRGIPLFASKGISQYFMFQTFAQCVHHKRRSTEVHVGHPHGEQVISSPYILYAVPLHRVGAATFYDFIKIVFHCSVLFVISEKLQKQPHPIPHATRSVPPVYADTTYRQAPKCRQPPRQPSPT